MWAFLPGGLLMPAALPTMARDKVEVDKKWTRDGLFDLQVRARVESHLTNFIRDYMKPLELEYSKIQATPNMDYDFRFYCTKESFAQAMAQACLDIDYQKFKPTAERRTAEGYVMYEDGKEYHSKLNSIWGVLASLGNPYGGSSWWGGSRAPKRTSGRTSTSRRAGTSRWDAPEALPEPTDDFVPASDAAAQELYEQLTDVPHAQWGDFAPEADLRNLERWLEENELAEAYHSEVVPAAVSGSIDEELPRV